MVARLDCCRDQNVAHLVFSSSAAAYGLPDVERVTEQTPCQPLSPYGESKLIGEWLIRDCTRAWGLNAICLRYFNVAGAAVPELGDPGAFNLIPLVFQALGREQRPQVFGADYPTPDGMGVRDYIHVSDVAHAHLAAARGLQAGAPSATYNIGRGKASASSRCSAPSARSPDSRWTTKSSRGGPVTPHASSPPSTKSATDWDSRPYTTCGPWSSQPGQAGSGATGSSEGYRTRSGRFAGASAVVDLPSAHSRCRAAHRCVECCRSARCAGRACGSLMLLDANLLLYAVDRTSPPVRVERALTGPAVNLAEQVRLRGASRTAAAAVLPLTGLAAIVVAGPVRTSRRCISAGHDISTQAKTTRPERAAATQAVPPSTPPGKAIRWP